MYNEDIIKSLPYNHKFSYDLLDLLYFIQNKLATELPTVEIDNYYFLVGALEHKKSSLFKLLDDNLTQSTISNISDSFHQYISSKALSAIKPSRSIKFSDDFKKIIEVAEEEREKTDKALISSYHVFLAILLDNSENNKIRKVFNKVGLTYSIALSKVSFIDANETNNISIRPISDKVSTNNDSNNKKSKIELDDDFKDAINLFFDKAVAKKNNKDSNIEQYCTNLNNLVQAGKIDNLIGRKKEIGQILRILGRKKKNNTILVGGEGVGKTAIAEHIAYKIVNKDVPSFLFDKIVVSLDMTALMAGTTLRGMFEERVKNIIDEIKNNGNYILFIDNIGTILANSGKNEYDISAMLSHSLANGEVQVIGTSDFASFRKTFDSNPSLSRLFQKIIVDAPTLQESKDILMGIKKSYEDFHKVRYTNEAIDACVTLADKYISDRNLPDSAIDLIDEAGSFYGTTNEGKEISEIGDKIKELSRRIDNEKKGSKNYDLIDSLSYELFSLNKNLNNTINQNEKEKENAPILITEDEIFYIVSLKTGIPISELNTDDKKKLMSMSDRLKSEVIGQDEQIDTICQAIKRNRIGLHNKGAMYSAMIIGKTGIGKTLVAKKLAKEIFGDEKKLLRFDMSEYSDKSSVSKLIGSNPGYIGYEEGGQLTEAIKNKKHCVLLLDEIEKADPEIYNIFLQVLDEGFLTDNSGMKIDFKNVIIIFTSNVGAKMADEFGKGIGFNEDADKNSKKILLKQLKNKFPPEFLNRLDNVLYFNNLSEDDIKKIIEIEINKMVERVKEIGYELTFSYHDIINFIHKKIQEEKDFGARPIIRAIQDEIENKIADKILEIETDEPCSFEILCHNDSILIK